MKISEFINELENIKNIVGDVDVVSEAVHGHYLPNVSIRSLAVVDGDYNAISYSRNDFKDIENIKTMKDETPKSEIVLVLD